MTRGGALDKIEGRIAAEGKLGRNGELRAAGLGLGGEVENAATVAGEIADGRAERRENF